jgi:hypothetical protein
MGTERTKLIFVADELLANDVINISIKKDDVCTIGFSDTDTYQSISEQIVYDNIERIGIFSHGSDTKFDFIGGIIDIEDTVQVDEFIKFILQIGNGRKSIHLDLFGCNTGKNISFIAALEDNEIIVSASDDNTGNPGDWIFEVGPEDSALVREIYFNDNILKWEGILTTASNYRPINDPNTTVVESIPIILQQCEWLEGEYYVLQSDPGITYVYSGSYSPSLLKICTFTATKMTVCEYRLPTRNLSAITRETGEEASASKAFKNLLVVFNTIHGFGLLTETSTTDVDVNPFIILDVLSNNIIMDKSSNGYKLSYQSTISFMESNNLANYDITVETPAGFDTTFLISAHGTHPSFLFLVGRDSIFTISNTGMNKNYTISPVVHTDYERIKRLLESNGIPAYEEVIEEVLESNGIPDYEEVIEELLESNGITEQYEVSEDLSPLSDIVDESITIDTPYDIKYTLLIDESANRTGNRWFRWIDFGPLTWLLVLFIITGVIIYGIWKKITYSLPQTMKQTECRY